MPSIKVLGSAMNATISRSEERRLAAAVPKDHVHLILTREQVTKLLAISETWDHTDTSIAVGDAKDVFNVIRQQIGMEDAGK